MRLQPLRPLLVNMKIELMTTLVGICLITGCATHEPRGGQLSDLPPSVQQTIREQAPHGDIAKVERKTRGGKLIYDIEFHDPKMNPELHIASDGTLLRGGRPMMRSAHVGAAPSSMRLEDLPVAVQNAIHSYSPNAQIVDIDREMRSGRPVYEIQFSEAGRNPKLHITEEGTLVDGN